MHSSSLLIVKTSLLNKMTPPPQKKKCNELMTFNLSDIDSEASFHLIILFTKYFEIVERWTFGIINAMDRMLMSCSNYFSF